MIGDYAVDPTRVYIAGFPAGGTMAAVLAGSDPEMFAAVGIHSGLPHGADVMSAFAAMQGVGTAGTGNTVPVIEFHGDRDPTVAPVNAAPWTPGAREEPRRVLAVEGRRARLVRCQSGRRLHVNRPGRFKRKWSGSSASTPNPSRPGDHEPPDRPADPRDSAPSPLADTSFDRGDRVAVSRDMNTTHGLCSQGAPLVVFLSPPNTAN